MHWDKDHLSTEGRPDLEQLEPPPADPDPEFGQLPFAPIYVLNKEEDHSYARKYFYSAPFMQADREREKQRNLSLVLPRNISPTKWDRYEQRFITEPIPGMVRAIPGIPIVHFIDGKPDQPVTFACVHTLDSLKPYKEFNEIEQCAVELAQLTFGVPAKEGSPRRPGVFELEGMSTNLRSKKVSSKDAVPGDGSYNLASTHGEGEGAGSFFPAVQTRTPEAEEIIARILVILHRLFRLIMPLSISKFEWSIITKIGESIQGLECHQSIRRCREA
uniref:Uncharacterized protein n=1 Tax=Mycena chlorophos TaxID=658473 RepID=A0ABQ0L9E5_MYCCL|nr:predicted protein [Mycena chlorophos]